ALGDDFGGIAGAFGPSLVYATPPPSKLLTRLKEVATTRGLASVDGLVGAGNQLRRNRQPKRLGGLKVDDQRELVGLPNGQIARVGAFQDRIDVVRGSAKLLSKIEAVEHQAAISHKIGRGIDRGQGVAGRELDE